MSAVNIPGGDAAASHRGGSNEGSGGLLGRALRIMCGPSEVIDAFRVIARHRFLRGVEVPTPTGHARGRQGLLSLQPPLLATEMLEPAGIDSGHHVVEARVRAVRTSRLPALY